jgi:hypothetical protein
MSRAVSYTFTVRDASGAYTTSTVQSCRASSTAGARWAAQALAHKLFPGSAATVKCINGTTNPQVWQADGRTDGKATA